MQVTELFGVVTMVEERSGNTDSGLLLPGIWLHMKLFSMFRKLNNGGIACRSLQQVDVDPSNTSGFVPIINGITKLF